MRGKALGPVCLMMFEEAQYDESERPIRPIGPDGCVS